MAANENLAKQRFGLGDGSGEMPALGFGTLIADPNDTRKAT